MVRNDRSPTFHLLRYAPTSEEKTSEQLDDSDECPHGFEESRIAPNAVSLWLHDETLRGITKQLLKEPDFKRRGA